MSNQQNAIKRPRIEGEPEGQGQAQEMPHNERVIEERYHDNNEVNNLAIEIMRFPSYGGITIDDILNHRHVALVPARVFGHLFLKLAQRKIAQKQISKILRAVDRIPPMRHSWGIVVNNILLKAIYDSDLKLAEIALRNGATPQLERILESEKRIVTNDDTDENRRISISMLTVACDIGFLRMVDLILHYLPELIGDTNAVRRAVANGNTELLDYFMRRGFNFRQIMFRNGDIDVDFAGDMLANVILDTEPHPTEKSLRWLYDNNLVTAEELADRTDPPSIAYILHHDGFDMSYMNSALITEAIEEDDRENRIDDSDDDETDDEHPEDELD